jgi:hypothetical protein
MSPLIFIGLFIFFIIIGLATRIEGFKSGSGNSCTKDDDCVTNVCLIDNKCL